MRGSRAYFPFPWKFRGELLTWRTAILKSFSELPQICGCEKYSIALRPLRSEVASTAKPGISWLILRPRLFLFCCPPEPKGLLSSTSWDSSKPCVDGAQLCPTLCDGVDCSPPGSSVHGILQARILGWVAVSYSKRSSWPRDRNTHLLYLLHWQVDSLPLGPLGFPLTKTLTSLIMGYSYPWSWEVGKSDKRAHLLFVGALPGSSTHHFTGHMQCFSYLLLHNKLSQSLAD